MEFTLYLSAIIAIGCGFWLVADGFERKNPLLVVIGMILSCSEFTLLLFNLTV